MTRFLLVTLGQKFCVDWYEACGQSSFAKHILEKIGNAESGSKRVARSGSTEVVSKDALSYQTHNSAYQYAGADKESRSSGALFNR